MNITKQVDDNRGMNRRLELIFSAVLTILMFLAPDATAQNPLTIGGNLTINIIAGAPGAQPVAVVKTTTLKYWRQAAAVAKITVQTLCPTQAFNLAVVATGVSKGTAAAQVSLVSGAPAIDFITNIPNAAGWASTTVTLNYTASATFAQGNSAEMGNDVHTVTYTLMVQ
jgi:hypothetical protein